MRTRDWMPAGKAALDEVERSERFVKLVLVGTGLYEVVCMVAVVLLMDWSSRTHLLLLVLACMVYGSLAFGMVALAGYQKRNTLRILSALELLDR